MQIGESLSDSEFQLCQKKNEGVLLAYKGQPPSTWAFGPTETMELECILLYWESATKFERVYLKSRHTKEKTHRTECVAVKSVDRTVYHWNLSPIELENISKEPMKNYTF